MKSKMTKEEYDIYINYGTPGNSKAKLIGIALKNTWHLDPSNTHTSLRMERKP